MAGVSSTAGPVPRTDAGTQTEAGVVVLSAAAYAALCRAAGAEPALAGHWEAQANGLALSAEEDEEGEDGVPVA